MTEPHPQRCERCEKHEISGIDDSRLKEDICGITGCTISPTILSWVEIHGCASFIGPLPNSPELIAMAKWEWKNREERRHLHAMIPWTVGWISGYLTPRNSIPEKNGDYDVHVWRAMPDHAMTLISRLLFWLWFPICPECGSRNIIEHGFRGKNYWLSCKDCGKTIYQGE